MSSPSLCVGSQCDPVIFSMSALWLVDIDLPWKQSFLILLTHPINHPIQLLDDFAFTLFNIGYSWFYQLVLSKEDTYMSTETPDNTSTLIHRSAVRWYAKRVTDIHSFAKILLNTGNTCCVWSIAVSRFKWWLNFHTMQRLKRLPFK